MSKTLSCNEIEEILSLSKFKGAKRIAVENFLITSSTDIKQSYALMNLDYDKRLYKWNSTTVNAIKFGLRKLYNKK